MTMSNKTFATGVTAALLTTVLLIVACGPAQPATKAQKKLAKLEEKKLEKWERKKEGGLENSGPTAGQTSGEDATPNDLSRFAASGCDESLWKHVYNPTRLQRLAPCIAASGTVAESLVDPDGDQHFLLHLDPGQDVLVNQRNDKKKSGSLVVEIVCANPVSLPKVKGACLGYTNKIPLPAIGAHIKAIGTYVIDSHNGWAEIHPVTRLERL